VSPRQRYSDEARPDGKKKSMFANLLNGVKSNPRRPTISTPSNPMHVTHVGIDNETGKFTVRTPPPRHWPSTQCLLIMNRVYRLSGNACSNRRV
jgi:hypothetical protein